METNTDSLPSPDEQNHNGSFGSSGFQDESPVYDARINSYTEVSAAQEADTDQKWAEEMERRDAERDSAEALTSAERAVARAREIWEQAALEAYLKKVSAA